MSPASTRTPIEETAAMTHTTAPRNRKERRAQIPNQNQPPTIPVSRPSLSSPVPTTTPKPKTLYEIAAERQRSFQQSSASPAPPAATSATDNNAQHTTLRINPDGTLSTISPTLSPPSQTKSQTQRLTADKHEVKAEDPLGPFASALFLSTTLAMLHFTLDVLVHHQYRQAIAWSEIGWRTAGALPLLLLLLATTNLLLPPSPSPSPSRSRLRLLRFPLSTRQLAFLALALLSGTYLLHVTNEAAYFAVLKRAPAIGTLWVWSVVELELGWALASVVGVGMGAWLRGYGVF